MTISTVGVIGLGAGTLAAYGRKGDEYRFYDINAQVVAVARQQFTFLADSDAHIVRGLIAILFAIYDGTSVDDVLAVDPNPIFAELGLNEHLTPQRSNGLASMVARIRSDAAGAIAHNAAAR